MAGTWTALRTQPNFNASTMLLLTDGTVMCHELDTKHWHKLTPDGSGSTPPERAYINGSWSRLADFNDDPNLTGAQGGPTYAPRFFASAVLADGTVFVAGGEFNNISVTGNKSQDVNTVELYDPVTDQWTNLSAPSGWDNLGDAPACVLPDGRVLVGNSFLNTNPVAIFDPATRQWQAAANKGDSCSEEGFTLLPDGTVLAVQCSNIPNSEKYIIGSDQWVSAGNTQVTLPQSCPGIVPEIGPAILLPDGRVFQIGATGATALYTPPATPTAPGTWAAGPTLTAQIGGSSQTMFPIDAPAVLLPNGKVLCVGSPAPPCKFPKPSNFFEFDPASNTATAITANTASGSQTPGNANVPCFMTRLLLLPTGQVLLSTGSKSIFVFTPDGSPVAAGKPAISSFNSDMAVGHTYSISGTQLNGLSQACAYGDDTQMATNYPLVQVTHASTKDRVFLRTSGHSTMGVATGASAQRTSVTVPPGLPTGQYQLVVIANGIASDPVTVVVHSPPPVGGIIVWHHQQTGETQIWQMNGNQITGRATVVDEHGNPIFVGLPFEVVGVGDVTGDGRADIVWHHRDTGETQIWQMNGNQITGRATVVDEHGNPIFVGLPFEVVGVGDVTGDGRADIVWHHQQTGETQIWQMNGNQITGRATVTGEQPVFVGLPFEVVGVGRG